MATVGDVILTARSYLGTPFQHMGRSRKGIDCVGLIICVGKELGLTSHEEFSYSESPDADQFFQKMRSHPDLKRKTINLLFPGDIISMLMPSYPCHVAIYTNMDTIIHAVSSKGQVVEHRLNRIWRNRITDVFSFCHLNRIKGVQ